MVGPRRAMGPRQGGTRGLASRDIGDGQGNVTYET